MELNEQKEYESLGKSKNLTVGITAKEVKLNRFVSTWVFDDILSEPSLSYFFRKAISWPLLAPRTNIYFATLICIALLVFIILSSSLIYRFFLGLSIMILSIMFVSYYDLFVQATFLKSLINRKVPSIKWTENYLAFLGFILLPEGDHNISVYGIGKKFGIAKSSANQMVNKLESFGLIKSEFKKGKRTFVFKGLNFEIQSAAISEGKKKLFEKYMDFLFKALCIINFYGNEKFSCREADRTG